MLLGVAVVMAKMQSGQFIALRTPQDGKWVASSATFHPDRHGMTVTFQPAEWPSVHINYATPLDLSKVGYITAWITNSGASDASLGMRVDDDKSADGNKHTRQGMVTIPAGKTIKIGLAIGAGTSESGMRGVPMPRGLTPLASNGGADWHPEHIVAMQFFMHQPEKPTTLYIQGQELEAAISLDGIVDKFGQYAGDNWPGKLKSESDWIARKAAESKEWTAQPAVANRDKFGGWSTGPTLKKTGFFRTEMRDGKWWMVDPDGKLFFSTGCNVVTPYQNTFITGRESMFKDLPKGDDPMAKFFYNASTDHGGRHIEGQSFSFTQANVARKFGTDWMAEFRSEALHRLPSWGFNTIGNWSEDGLYRNDKVPYVATAYVGGTHKRVASGNDYWGLMHDPFDPQFGLDVAAGVKEAANKVKGDPWCLGTFVDNELSWAGAGPEGGRYGLAIGALGNGMDSPAKAAMIQMLEKKYASISDLNTAWETSFAAWTNLESPRKDEWKFTDPQRKDFAAFVSLLSETYHRVVSEELKKADPDHLYLGCRFAWYGRDAVEAAAKYTDVISFNIYAEEPKRDTWDWINKLGKPVIIGEFHFGATDRGMFHPGLVDAHSQAGRAAMYEQYLRAVASNPAFVGCHWFQYQDEPLTGRVLDGENYQIGMVDVTDTPYPEAIAAARKIHAQIYDLHQAAK